MRPLDIFLATLVSISWGVNFVFAKVDLMDIAPLTLLAARFFCVALLLLPWCFKVKKHQWVPLVGIALVMGGYFSILFIGMQGIPSSETTILVQLQVPLGGLIAYFYLKEPLSIKVIVGTIVALVGVVITVGIPEQHGELWSALMVLSAAIFWAFSSNQVKALGPINPMALNAVVALVCLPIFTVWSLWQEPRGLESFINASVLDYGAFAYMVLISIIFAYTVWFKLLQRNPVSMVVPFILLQPPVGMVAGHFILGEPILLHMVIGGIVCMLGLAIVVVHPQRNKSAV